MAKHSLKRHAPDTQLIRFFEMLLNFSRRISVNPYKRFWQVFRAFNLEDITCSAAQYFLLHKLIQPFENSLFIQWLSYEHSFISSSERNITSSCIDTQLTFFKNAVIMFSLNIFTRPLIPTCSFCITRFSDPLSRMFYFTPKRTTSFAVIITFYLFLEIVLSKAARTNYPQ